MWEGYVALGVALLFVGFLLHGTYRRSEEFTTMKGSYPTLDDIQKTVRAIMDQYYDYNISEFNKIKDIEEILKSGGFRQEIYGDLAMPQSAQQTARIASAYVNGKSLNEQTKQAKDFYGSFRPFATAGYTGSSEALIEELHMYRKWLTDKIKNYKNDGKPNIEMDRHAPIEEMLDISLKLDVVSLYLKNTLTRGYLKLAMEKTSPKPKAA